MFAWLFRAREGNHRVGVARRTILNGNLLYTILPIQNGIDVYNETQLYLAQLEWEQQKILRLAEKRGVNIKAG